MAPVVPPVGFSAVGGVTTKVRFFAQNRSREYRQKVTATTLFQTAFHRVFQLLSQTAHVRFRRRKRVHGERSHTTAHTPKQVAFRMGVVSLPSERSACSQTSPARVSERQTLPLLGLGLVCARRTQKACGTAMRFYARRCSEASQSRWAA